MRGLFFQAFIILFRSSVWLLSIRVKPIQTWFSFIWLGRLTFCTGEILHCKHIQSLHSNQMKQTTVEKKVVKNTCNNWMQQLCHETGREKKREKLLRKRLVDNFSLQNIAIVFYLFRLRQEFHSTRNNFYRKWRIMALQATTTTTGEIRCKKSRKKLRIRLEALQLNLNWSWSLTIRY